MTSQDTLAMMFVVGYVAMSVFFGWVLFQPPKGSVHQERMDVFELAQLGIIWPVWLVLVAVVWCAVKLEKETQ